LIDGCTGFAFNRTGKSGFGYKISSPAGIFTVELPALFVTLRHIGEVIQPLEKCLLLTDSLSSVKALVSRKISHRTHLLDYECKQMCSDLLEDGVEVEIMWIPAHVGLKGNDIVDERVRHMALNGAVFERPLPQVNFQGLASSVLLREWQGKWNAADTGRFTHYKLSRVSLRPWFEGQRNDRKFVSTVSRIMSDHCTARSHLSRFRIVEGAVCICLKDYETVDHLIWHCERFETDRRCLTDAITALEVLELQIDDLNVLFKG
jgi:ribonuclease HI